MTYHLKDGKLPSPTLRIMGVRPSNLYIGRYAVILLTLLCCALMACNGSIGFENDPRKETVGTTPEEPGTTPEEPGTTPEEPGTTPEEPETPPEEPETPPDPIACADYTTTDLPYSPLGKYLEIDFDTPTSTAGSVEAILQQRWDPANTFKSTTSSVSTVAGASIDGTESNSGSSSLKFSVEADASSRTYIQYYDIHLLADDSDTTMAQCALPESARYSFYLNIAAGNLDYTDFSQYWNIIQFRNGSGDQFPTNGSSGEDVSLWLRPNEDQSAGVTYSLGIYNSQDPANDWGESYFADPAQNLSRGQWYKIDIDLVRRADATGSVKVHVDDIQVINATNVPTQFSGNNVPYVFFGSGVSAGISEATEINVDDFSISPIP